MSESIPPLPSSTPAPAFEDSGKKMDKSKPEVTSQIPKKSATEHVGSNILKRNVKQANASGITTKQESLTPEQLRATNVYKKDLQALQQSRINCWLQENKPYIEKCLNDEKLAKIAPFKIYMVIGGKRHQLIPDHSHFSDTGYKKVKKATIESLNQIKQNQPQSEELKKQLQICTRKVEASEKALQALSLSPVNYSKNGFPDVGIRINMYPDENKPATAIAYSLKKGSLVQPVQHGNDVIEIENAGLPEHRPEEVDKQEDK